MLIPFFLFSVFPFCLLTCLLACELACLFACVRACLLACLLFCTTGAYAAGGCPHPKQSAEVDARFLGWLSCGRLLPILCGAQARTRARHSLASLSPAGSLRSQGNCHKLQRCVGTYRLLGTEVTDVLLHCLQVHDYLSASLGHAKLHAVSRALCRPSLKPTVRVNTLAASVQVCVITSLPRNHGCMHKIQRVPSTCCPAEARHTNGAASSLLSP
eukprot:361082-Chlamydomonas_euryale.AAC.1